MFSLLALVLALVALTTARPLQEASTNATTQPELLQRSTTLQPLMDGQGFPDPAIIRTSLTDWYAFATNAVILGKTIHVQMAHTSDYKTWTYLKKQDAMPKLAKWIDSSSPRVWAPDVSLLPDGTFIMYYTAALKSAPATHCVSWATSKKVTGPYEDKNDEPFICPTAEGGAIDPNGFLNESDNTRWITYKIDGNSIGHGGSCNNGVAPIVSTPIMLQQVDASDGHTPIGSPIEMFTNGVLDGPYVEAPSLSYLGGKYVAFFSSNCFTTPLYDVSYAIADDIRGPYNKYGPLFVTGDFGMTAPGGLDVAVNGNHAVWHANVAQADTGAGCVGATKGAKDCKDNATPGRGMFSAMLSLEGTVVTASVLA